MASKSSSGKAATGFLAYGLPIVCGIAQGTWTNVHNTVRTTVLAGAVVGGEYQECIIQLIN